MDPHPSHDDLTEIERRLRAWQPDRAQLDADAMLFAAGQALGRRSRRRHFWPVLCALLAAQSSGVMLWGLAERAGRQALAPRVHDSAPAAAVAFVPDSANGAPPDDSLRRRRRQEHELSHELASLPAPMPAPAPPPGAPIWRAGQRHGVPGL